MKHNRIFLLTSLLIGIALLAGLFFPILSVNAQSPGQDTGTSHPRLVRLLERERGLLDNLQTRLENAAAAEDRLQDGIVRAQAAGADTAALEEALAAWQQGVAEGQSSADSAALILASPDGFDTAGQVTDAAAARTSLRAAAGDLGQSAATLRAARLALQAAVADWQAEHPGLLEDVDTGS